MSIFVTWDQVALTDQTGVSPMYQVLYQPLQTFGGAINEESVNVTGLSVTLTGLEECHFLIVERCNSKILARSTA